MALFGAQRSNASPHLVEFKAGKLKYDEADKMVKPDPRKGVVYITQGEDGITHFCWKERQAASPEDELMVFPDDVEFLKVKKCTTGRVYVLRFKTSSRKLYFWMQEPNEEKDADLVKKVNDYVNGRNMPGTRSGGRGGGRSALPAELQALGIDESNLHEYFGDVDHEQLGQLFSGGGAGNMALLSSLLGGGQVGATPGGASQQEQAAGAGSRSARGTAALATAATAVPLPAGQSDSAKRSTGQPASATGASGGTNVVQLADLQRALQGVTALSPALRPPVAIDLSNTLTREALEPLLTNPEFVERLVQHLPDDPSVAKDKAELLETIQSPQFVNVAKSFSEAFLSGRLGAVVREFACPPAAVAAADSGNLQEFVRAMEEEAGKKKQGAANEASGSSATSSKPSGGDNKKDSNDMDLD